jgi:hypothetical protein
VVQVGGGASCGVVQVPLRSGPARSAVSADDVEGTGESIEIESGDDHMRNSHTQSRPRHHGLYTDPPPVSPPGPSGLPPRIRSGSPDILVEHI